MTISGTILVALGMIVRARSSFREALGTTPMGTEGQPDRVELLAHLLERGMHPKLTKAQANGAAKKVRDAAVSLRGVLDDGRMAIAKVELFQRIRTATGRAAQFELAS